MLSQWRGKRQQVPRDRFGASPSPSDFSRSDTESPKPVHGAKITSAARSKGVAAFTKTIGRKRDASISGQPGINFAAGPRSSGRSGQSFELGGGVVPLSSSSRDHGSPSFIDFNEDDASTSGDTGQHDKDDIPTAVISWDSPRASHSPSNSSNYDSRTDASGSKFSSIDESGLMSPEDFEDLSAILAFTSPESQESPSSVLTGSTPLTTPETIQKEASSSMSPASVSSNQQALRTKRVLAPSIPQRKASASNAQGGTAQTVTKRSLTEALAALGPKQGLVASPNPGSEASPRLLEEPPLSIHHRRGNSVSSFPETVSGPSSSLMDSKEFGSPLANGRENGLDAFARGRGFAGTAAMEGAHGLGITADDGGGSLPQLGNTQDRSTASKPSSTAPTVSLNNTHQKSGSVASVQSSVDSVGRSSLFMEASKRFVDGSEEKDRFLMDGNAKMPVSDSDHSVNTAETSTDHHDMEPLGTIAEKAEGMDSREAGSSSLRGASLESNARRSLMETFGSRSSQSSAATVATDDTTPVSPLSRIRINPTNGVSGTSTTNVSRAPSLNLGQNTSGIVGIGSPTFGFGFKSNSKRLTDDTLEMTSSDRPSSVAAALAAAPEASTTASSQNFSSAPIGSQAQPSTPSDITVSARAQGEQIEAIEQVNSEPLPSGPFPGGVTPSPSTENGLAFSSLPSTPNMSMSSDSKGKRRKNRPAALTLSKSLSNLHAAASAAPTPPGVVLRGLASPSRLRAPPPSAPPPSEPLPPIPTTPSIMTPKSPMFPGRFGVAARASPAIGAAPDFPLSQTATSLESLSRSALSRFEESSSTPRSLSRSKLTIEEAAGGDKDVARKSQAHDDISDNGSEREYVLDSVEPGLDVQAAPLSGNERLSSILDLGIEQLGGRESVASFETFYSSVAEEAQLAVAQTLTRVPSSAVRVSMPKEKVTPANSKKVEANIERKEPIETGAPPSIVNRTRASIENLQNAARAAGQGVSKPPPSAWNRNFYASNKHDRPSSATSSIAAGAGVSGGKAATDMGHERNVYTPSNSIIVGRRASIGSIQSRRHEMDQDRMSLAAAKDEKAKVDILKRTEGRFTGAFGEIAQAFRQLQAEKRALEAIVRDTTPLEGLGQNNEGLGNYLSEVKAKMETNTAEIRKLLGLLDQQRNVMDCMVETHRLEVASLLDEIEGLHDELDVANLEAEKKQTEMAQLAEALKQARFEAEKARAETAQAHEAIADESDNREKAVLLLRGARNQLQEVEDSRSKLIEADAVREAELNALRQDLERSRDEVALLRAEQTGDSSDQELLRTPPMHQQSEVDRLRRLLEERDAEIAQLKLGHADAAVDAASNAEDDAAHVDDSVEVLRSQLSAQRSRETQIRTAYRLLREELRKTQTAANTAGRQLKRLSLPLATANSPTQTSSMSADTPPSSYRGPRNSVHFGTTRIPYLETPTEDQGSSK